MSLGVAIETDEAQALQGDVDRSLLIVDDEPSMRDMLSIARADEGYALHTAAAGDEAFVENVGFVFDSVAV